jgi:hypothetical protein
MLTVPFVVLIDADHLVCEPLAVVKALLRAGALPRFQSAWGKALGGDCHAVAGAMTTDLAAAGQFGWVRCRAHCDRIGDHSWVGVRRLGIRRLERMSPRRIGAPGGRLSRATLCGPGQSAAARSSKLEHPRGVPYHFVAYETIFKVMWSNTTIATALERARDGSLPGREAAAMSAMMWGLWEYIVFDRGAAQDRLRSTAPAPSSIRFSSRSSARGVVVPFRSLRA